MVGDQPGGEGDPGVTNVEIRLANLDEVKPDYVNLVHVTIEPISFQLVFSRVMQPVVTTQEDRDRWQSAKTVDATVVARLIMDPVVAEQTIGVLRLQLEAFQRQFGAPTNAEQGGDGA